MFGWLFDKRSPVEKFWSWFQANQDLYERPLTSKSFAALNSRLAEVHADLVWEIANSDSGNTFLISAAGDRELISHVLELGKHSPALPGWKIVTFRQRQQPTVCLANLSFVLVENPNSSLPDLLIYVDGLERSNYETKLSECVLGLHMLLGEYETMTMLGEIEVAPLWSTSGNQRCMEELPQVLGERAVSVTGSVH